MMRYIRYFLLLVLTISLVTLALANHQAVTLRLLPDDLAALAGLNHTVSLPLFVVIFGGIGAGVLIGFIWEWLREHKLRAEAAAQARELARLEREVAKSATITPKDEVLALLDAPVAASGR